MPNNGWYQLESNRPVSGRNGKNRGIPTNRPSQPQKADTPPEKKPPRAPIKPLPVENMQRKPETAPPRPPAGPRPPKPGGIPVSPTTNTLQSGETRTQHSETVGERGPMPAYDMVLHETLETFVHSKKVERAVHVKGFGAFGYFQLKNSMRQFTKAPIFQTPGQQIPVVTRFSLAVSTKGTPDTSRNVRGFSTKFYTDNGVFDLLCNHLPVFTVRDAMRFPDSINSFLPSPVSNLADPERFWSFTARAPESTHFITWLYSDVGTVKSLRHIHGYSVNTYVWRNAEGKRHYVKYHWVPIAGEMYIDREEAGKLAGENPDICGQDLWDTIAGGGTAEYDLCVQLMDPKDEENLPFDPLDDTKTWDEDEYPLIEVGRLVLNRNPQNFDEQVEKVAFSPANLLDGIELSNDKMLQGRSFIYNDAQRYRLGPEFREIPVNKQPNYNPDQQVTTGLGEMEEGRLTRSDIPKMDDFAQAGERYRSLSEQAQANLVENIAVELPLVSRPVQETVLGYFRKADPAFGERVAEAMQKHAK